MTPTDDEPNSPPFNGPAEPSLIVWSFQALQPGNWTYRCGMHPNSMTGAIQVLAQPRPVNLTLIGDSTRGWGFSNATIRNPGPPPVLPRGTIPLITGIMVGALGFVLVFAALYHVRAVRAAKRAR